MAITLKLDPEQLTSLVGAIDRLSDNLAKWQGNQTVALETGFNDLVTTFGGTRGEDVQARIDALTSEVKTEADALERTSQSEV
jgi:hypothetical protein